jgi:meso-butanediol dehydrogenase/(S,S)-butanediol dehydrogenase/diacetyl reductase
MAVATDGPDLEGRIVLITGTGRGQGRSAALAFAAAGAMVVGCDLDAEAAAETVELVAAAGGTMSGAEAVDLGDHRQAQAWVESAAAAHGGVDVLFNNASAARFGPIEEISIDDWKFTVRNELDLVFFTCKYAWAYLKERSGVIINTASVAGLVGFRWHGELAHVATKGGVIAMTRQLAAEGAPHGIRAVSISPGGIETPATAEMYADPEIRAAILGSQLVPRPGRPDDVVGLAVFLASDAAGFITGTNLVVDGGVTAV